MKRVLIVGASGWGREILEVMLRDPSCGKDWEIKGFLDTRANILDDFDYPVGVVGSPMNYVPQQGDVFVSAIGAPQGRKTYLQPLLEKGAEFMTWGAQGYQEGTTRIGQGCVLEQGVRIGANSRVDPFAVLLTQAVIGHDVHVGEYAFIGVMACVSGGVRIGPLASINSNATIIPGIKIGAGATVGAGAVVVKDVPAGATVFGNPAKIIFRE
jgi:sugar O-acyltransferase (sialic acid O-acetyltransferase NeuD family)